MDYLNNFYHGVLEKGYNPEEVFNTWKYAGGDKQKRHISYWNMMTMAHKIKRPTTTNKCLCGHHIVENCFITDGTNVLVVGNECIKKYVKKKTRSCERCGDTHRARLHNYCRKCKASAGLCLIKPGC
jgi:hypothetical protein